MKVCLVAKVHNKIQILLLWNRCYSKENLLVQMYGIQDTFSHQNNVIMVANSQSGIQSLFSY